jgi:hypothetical protein
VLRKVKLLQLIGLKRVANIFSGVSDTYLEAVAGFTNTIKHNQVLDAQTVLSHGLRHEFLKNMVVTEEQYEFMKREVMKELNEKIVTNARTAQKAKVGYFN